MAIFESPTYKKQNIADSGKWNAEGKPAPLEVSGDVLMAKCEVDAAYSEDDRVRLFKFPTGTTLLYIMYRTTQTSTASATIAFGSTSDEDEFTSSISLTNSGTRNFYGVLPNESLDSDGVLLLTFKGADPPSDFEADIYVLYTTAPGT